MRRNPSSVSVLAALVVILSQAQRPVGHKLLAGKVVTSRWALRRCDPHGDLRKALRAGP